MLSRRQFLATSAATPLLATLRTPGFAAAMPASSQAFAWDVYRHLAGATQESVFLSPFSVRTALAMTAAGATGATLAEMQSALRLGTDPAATDAAFQKLLAAIDGKKAYQLVTANRLWVQEGRALKPGFVRRAEAGYRAGAKTLNFETAFEPSRKAINDWVAATTNQRIKDLLPAGSIDAKTRLVLTNAIYFKGLWQTPFDKSLTRQSPFFCADGTQKPVPLMHAPQGVSASDLPNRPFQSAELSYQGNDLGFLVIVPRDPRGLTNVERQLTADDLEAVVRENQRGPNQLYLPKMKLEFTAELTPAMKSLGMRAAFEDHAEFGGMTDAENLKIGGIHHKAFVEVDEAGTEAAAATGVVMMPTMAAPQPQKPIIVRADRPFLLAIRHRPTGELLFLGRYVG